MSTLHNGYAKIFGSLVDVFPDTSNLLVSVGLVRYFLKHKPQDIHTIYRGMKKTFVSYKKKKKQLTFFLLSPGQSKGNRRSRSKRP